MTFDRLMMDPRYVHAKAIIDNLIVDEDYEYANEPYFHDRVTWLEVLRIAYASYMANTSEKMQTIAQLKKQINRQSLQIWLKWCNGIRKGTITPHFGATEDLHNYRKSPGINRWQSLYASNFDANIRTCGNHKIGFNRYIGQFSDKPFEMDDQIIGIAKKEIMEIVKSYRQDLSLEIKANKANFNVYLSKGIGENRIVTKTTIQAFSLHPQQYRHIHHVAKHIDMFENLPKMIREDFILGGWPEDREFVPVFTLNEYTTGNPQGQMETRVNVHLKAEYEGIGHKLKFEPFVEGLGFISVHAMETDEFLKEYHCSTCGITRSNSSKNTQTLMSSVQAAGRLASTRLRKREKVLKNNGKDTFEIDAVTTHLMGLVEKYYSEEIEKIYTQTSTPIKMKLEEFEGFVKGKGKRKKETINFGISEGKLTSQVYITDKILWKRGKLLVPAIPKTMMIAITGKHAHEVVEHPIADLLGKVKRVYPVSFDENIGTWISFEPKKDLVRIKA